MLINALLPGEGMQYPKSTIIPQVFGTGAGKYRYSDRAWKLDL